VRLALRVLDGVGLEPASAVSPARLAVTDRDREEAARVLGRSGAGEAEYAVVVPGAAFGPAKTWPSERFRELCERLAGSLSVILAGSGAERELCATVGEGLHGVSSVAGETSLGGFFALLAGARVAVANDSGTPHASAALGTPTVVLFGSTSPQWTAPRGDQVTVVQNPVHCNPCFRRTCPTQLECFRGIGVERVLEEALHLLSPSIESETGPTRA
jgi:heptosyltransferase-2